MSANDAGTVAPSTGSDAQAQFARMKARLLARYRLSTVPGREEELVRPVTSEGPARGVSLGYGCKTIRVRLMAGREWIRTEDFQITAHQSDGWKAELDRMCDTYFGYVGPDSMNRHPIVRQTSIL